MRQLFRTWWLVALLVVECPLLAIEGLYRLCLASAGPMPLPPRSAVERVSSTNPILGLDIVAFVVMVQFVKPHRANRMSLSRPGAQELARRWRWAQPQRPRMLLWHAWNSATTIWISRNWTEAELVDAESIDLRSLRIVRPTELE